jgi:hypothetical protein
VQVVPPPRNWEQPAPVVRVQVPLAAQQAPSGRLTGWPLMTAGSQEGEGLPAEQVEPAPRKVLLPVQLAPMVEEQVLVLEQQAPRRAVQGLGEQTVPAPWKLVPVVVQPDWMVDVQTPAVEQQAPRREVQGLGEQAVPSPR